MSPLPIGIQSIHKILQQGYLYVDKTQFAYNLIHSGTPHYFLSRPRRFGKSLFLSTLAAILQGEKDLFAGCAIAQTNEEIYVYNPFSTLNFMDERQPQSYWYSSGTPSFLISQLQKHPETLVPLTGATARKSELTDISGLETLDLKALMFQTGYLTITGYHERAQQYTLSFPNQEVQEAFMDSLVSHFAPHNTRIRNAGYEALVQCEPTAFFAQVQTDIAAFPNLFFSRAQESTYHMVLLGLMRGMGLTVTAEVLTHLGRLDLVVDMPHIIYILELKLDKSPQEALDQMQQKHYYQPYLRQDKQVGLLGVQFSSQVRNLTDWLGMLLDAEGNLIRYLQPKPTDISKKHI